MSKMITRTALADKLKELMKVKKLSKITVSDITTACGISRNAFYYHFTDKYDLVNWVFVSETLPVINTFSDPDRYFDGFINLCQHIHNNKSFYMEAFSYAGQNSLWETLFDLYFELIQIHIATLYAKRGYRLTEDELFILARMETHAYVGTIREWVQNGMKEDYAAYFEKLRAVKAGFAFPVDMTNL